MRPIALAVGGAFACAAALVAGSAFAAAQPVPPAPGTAAARPAYAFDIPEGWGNTLRIGTEQRWIPPKTPDPLRPTEFVRITATADQRDVETYALEMMKVEHGGGAEIVDEGVTTACDGQPAHRWTARTPTYSAGRIEEHALVTAVTGGVGLVQYVHPQGETPRADALGALTSLCPAPFEMPRIDGWTGFPTTPPGIVRLTSPDRTASFYGSYRRLSHERFPSTFSNDPRATVIKSWSETCTNGELIRTDLSKDAQTLEVAWGYVRGYSYVFTYEHLTARPAEPAAEAALTQFCAPR